MTEKPPVPSDQALAFLQSLPPAPPPWEREIGDMRRDAREQALALRGEAEPVVSTEDIVTAGVSSRLYRPFGRERNVLVWLHGGGWVIRDVDCYDAVVRAIANRAECAVLSVDYRLAPEHRYPAAIDDAWSATDWALEEFDLVAVGGDSAGGNLSAAIALRARDRNLPLALQVLVYPVLDYAAVEGTFYDDFRDRYDAFAGGTGFGATFQRAIRWIWEQYIPTPTRRLEPDASPMQAKTLTGVAPALVITAEHDILRGEGEEYARRLLEEDVAVDLINYDGQVHDFLQGLGTIDDAQDALERIAVALRKAFRVPEIAP